MMVDLAIVVAGPVEHREVVLETGLELRAVDQAAVGPQTALGSWHGVVQVVVEPAALLAVDLAAVHLDPQAVRLRGPEILVACGLLDDMALAGGTPFQSEHIGEALHALGLALGGLRMGLAGVCNRLGTNRILGAGQRQQVAELRGVDHHARGESGASRRHRARSPLPRRSGHPWFRRPRPWRARAASAGRRGYSGSSRAIIAATATFGSKATRVTQQLPGLKCACLPAAPACGR